MTERKLTFREKLIKYLGMTPAHMDKVERQIIEDSYPGETEKKLKTHSWIDYPQDSNRVCRDCLIWYQLFNYADKVEWVLKGRAVGDVKIEEAACHERLPYDRITVPRRPVSRRAERTCNLSSFDPRYS